MRLIVWGGILGSRLLSTLATTFSDGWRLREGKEGGEGREGGERGRGEREGVRSSKVTRGFLSALATTISDG